MSVSPPASRFVGENTNKGEKLGQAGKKLEPDPKVNIVVIRGKGYKLN